MSAGPSERAAPRSLVGRLEGHLSGLHIGSKNEKNPERNLLHKPHQNSASKPSSPLTQTRFWDKSPARATHTRSESQPGPFVLPQTTFSSPKHSSTPAAATPERKRTVKAVLDLPSKLDLSGKLRKLNPMSPRTSTPDRRDDEPKDQKAERASSSRPNTLSNDQELVPVPPSSYPFPTEGEDVASIPDEAPELTNSFVQCVELYSVKASSSIFKETLGITVSPKGRWIATYSPSALHIIRAKSLPYIEAKGFLIHQKPACVALEDDRGILAVASRQNLVDVYRFDTDQEGPFDPAVKDLALGVHVSNVVQSMSISPDGKLLAVGHDGGIDVISIASPEQRRSVLCGPSSSTSFSLNSRTILSTGLYHRAPLSTLLNASDFSGPGLDSNFPLFCQPHEAWLKQVIFPERDLQAAQAVLIPNPKVDNINELVAYDKNDHSWGIFQISSRSFIRLRLPPSDSLRWRQEGEALEEAFPAVLADPFRIAVATRKRFCSEIRLFQFDTSWHDKLEAGELDADKYGMAFIEPYACIELGAVDDVGFSTLNTLRWYQDGTNVPARLLASTDSLKRLIPSDSGAFPPTSAGRIYMIDLYPSIQPPSNLSANTNFSVNLDEIHCSSTLNSGDVSWQTWERKHPPASIIHPDGYEMFASLEKPFTDDGSTLYGSISRRSYNSASKAAMGGTTDSPRKHSGLGGESQSSFIPTPLVGDAYQQRRGSEAGHQLASAGDLAPKIEYPIESTNLDALQKTLDNTTTSSLPVGNALPVESRPPLVDQVSDSALNQLVVEDKEPTWRGETATQDNFVNSSPRQFNIGSKGAAYSVYSNRPDVLHPPSSNTQPKQPVYPTHSRQQSGGINGSPSRTYRPSHSRQQSGDGKVQRPAAHSRQPSEQPSVRVAIDTKPEQALLGNRALGKAIDNNKSLAQPLQFTPTTNMVLAPPAYPRLGGSQYVASETPPLDEKPKSGHADGMAQAGASTAEGTRHQNIQAAMNSLTNSNGGMKGVSIGPESKESRQAGDPLSLQPQFPSSLSAPPKPISLIPVFSHSTPDLPMQAVGPKGPNTKGVSTFQTASSATVADGTGGPMTRPRAGSSGLGGSAVIIGLPDGDDSSRLTDPPAISRAGTDGAVGASTTLRGDENARPRGASVYQFLKFRNHLGASGKHGSAIGSVDGSRNGDEKARRERLKVGKCVVM